MEHAAFSLDQVHVPGEGGRDRGGGVLYASLRTLLNKVVLEVYIFVGFVLTMGVIAQITAKHLRYSSNTRSATHYSI